MKKLWLLTRICGFICNMEEQNKLKSMDFFWLYLSSYSSSRLEVDIQERWRNLFFDSKAPGLVISYSYGRVRPPPSAVLPASSKRGARGSPIP